MIKQLTYNQLPENWKTSLYEDQNFRERFCRSWKTNNEESFWSRLFFSEHKIEYDFRINKNKNVFFLCRNSNNIELLYLHVGTGKKAFKKMLGFKSSFIDCSPTKNGAKKDIEKDFLNF